MISGIIANLFFGFVGGIAFFYGKKKERYSAMIIGGALMAFPYFVDSTLWLWVIGCGLTIALFVFRE